MAVSIKHLFFSLPSLVDFPVGPEGEIMFREIALPSMTPPSSSEICDKADPRHLQLLSSSLYLPFFLPFEPPIHPPPYTSAYSDGQSRSY